MTKVDERVDEQPVARPRRPRTVILVAFGLLALILLLAGLGGNSYQAKSQNVQKNDNSEYLPESADSTKVSNAAQKFNSQATIPGFVVYQRSGGLTTADKTKIAGYENNMPSYKGKIAEDDLVRIVAYIKSLGANKDQAND